MSKAPKVTFPIKPPGPPKVWNVVECVMKGEEKPTKFSIQEIPEDRYDDVLDHMCKYFIADEPISVSLKGIDDAEFVEHFRKFWKKFLEQGLSVGAFVENPDGGKPIIAGLNILYLCLKDEDEDDVPKSTSKKANLIMDTVSSLDKSASVHEKYGVDRYLSAIGLSVHPSYRGAALGARILNARENIGREYEIPVTSTVFTSPISQKLAERCGFETVIEKNYDEIFDKEGNLAFPGISAKICKIMAKRLY